MAQDILIKRSSTTASPSTLENGELAYSSSSNKLFIGRPGGTTGDVDAIGGKAFTDKLDGIEAGATADQTAGEIKTAYESNADTNAYTDSEKSKLSGIEAGATGDQTSSEIKSLYESNANTNAYTDAEKTKLSGIETNATGDQTAGEIKTAYESNANTNAYTDAEKSKLAGVATNANNYQLADLNADLAGGVGNIVTTGYLRGPSNFVIDPATHGNDTGTLTIAGDLVVSGTTTTVNSTEINLADNIINLNSAQDELTLPPSTMIAGIQVDRGSAANDAYILWRETVDKWFVSTGGPFDYELLTAISDLDGGTF